MLTSNDQVAKTEFVQQNEPCYLIYEVIKPAPDSKTRRRYRHILVGRDDKLAMYVEDLGLAELLPHWQESQIKTGGIEGGKAWSEHTVGEAIGMMEQYRESHRDTEDLPHLLHDLEDGYETTNEMRGRPKGRKVFGT